MELLFILISDLLGHILNRQNPNIVYGTNISKIKIFSDLLKDCSLRKYNFVNVFNVKNNYKRYKVLRGTTGVCKMQIIQQSFVLHAFISDDELRNGLP